MSLFSFSDLPSGTLFKVMLGISSKNLLRLLIAISNSNLAALSSLEMTVASVNLLAFKFSSFSLAISFAKIFDFS